MIWSNDYGEYKLRSNFNKFLVVSAFSLSVLMQGNIKRLFDTGSYNQNILGFIFRWSQTFAINFQYYISLLLAHSILIIESAKYYRGIFWFSFP